jgi:hypothetical protein
MKIKKNLLWTLAIIGVLAIASCASQPSPTAYDPPSFFMGIFHGFIILFSFIGSIFTDVRIYAFPNSGVMYDFGYLIGLFFWLAFVA